MDKEDVSTVTQYASTRELDAVFFYCDSSGTGLVPVSRLIHHLKLVTTGTSEETSELLTLQNILDPEGKDLSIEKQTFEDAVLQFMEGATRLSTVYNEDDSAPTDTEEKCTTPVNSFKKKLSSLVLNTPNSSPKISQTYFALKENVLNQSIETTGLAILDKPFLFHDEGDRGELMSQFETLQFQNNKLFEENSALKQQLVSTEESMTGLSHKYEKLKRDAKSHQSTVEKLQKVRLENEDVKANLINLMDEKKEMQLKFRKLEQDHGLLESSKNELEDQVFELTSHLENNKKIQKKLQTSLKEHKKMLAEVEVVATAQENQLLEENTKVKELEKTVKDFNKVNEILRQEKTDLEVQLNHTQHELTSLRLKSEKIPLNGSDDLDELTEEEFMPVLGLAPTCSSTPFHSKLSSLCSELVQNIQDEPRLPSPLCDKELEEVIGNLEDEGKDTGLTPKPTDTEQIKSGSGNFAATPETPVVQHLSLPVRSREKTTLRKQMSELLQKEERLKRRYNKRILVYREKVRKLTEENQEIKADYSAAQKDLQTEIKVKVELEEKVRKEAESVREQQEKVYRLQDDLVVENNLKEKIQQQLSESKKVISQMESDLKLSKKTIEQLTAKETELELQVQSLDSARAELNELYQQSEVRLFELNDVYEKSSIENQSVISNLQDEVKSVKQIDMKGLWDVVNNEDSNTEMVGRPYRDISEKVLREIESLKCQLERRQVVLTLLQAKPFSKSQCSEETADRTSGIEATLLDALTIDCLEQTRDRDSRINLSRSGSTSCPQFKNLNFNASQPQKPNPLTTAQQPPSLLGKKKRVLASTLSLRSATSQSGVSDNACSEQFGSTKRQQSPRKEKKSPVLKVLSQGLKYALDRGSSGDSGVAVDHSKNCPSASHIPPAQSGLLATESDLHKVEGGTTLDPLKAGNFNYEEKRRGYFQEASLESVADSHEDSAQIYRLDPQSQVDACDMYKSHSPDNNRRLSILSEKQESSELEEEGTCEESTPTPTPLRQKRKRKANQGIANSVSVVAHFKPSTSDQDGGSSSETSQEVTDQHSVGEPQPHGSHSLPPTNDKTPSITAEESETNNNTEKSSEIREPSDNETGDTCVVTGESSQCVEMKVHSGEDNTQSGGEVTAATRTRQQRKQSLELIHRQTTLDDLQQVEDLTAVTPSEQDPVSVVDKVQSGGNGGALEENSTGERQETGFKLVNKEESHTEKHSLMKDSEACHDESFECDIKQEILQGLQQSQLASSCPTTPKILKGLELEKVRKENVAAKKKKVPTATLR